MTALASEPSENARFYTDVLGLRLIKQTVKFDDLTTYHLYYGDEQGTPGTVMTVFPYPDGTDGYPGTGEASATAFSVPTGALEYWGDRFGRFGVETAGPENRFGRSVLPFRDPDGQRLELVPTDGVGNVDPWSGSDVPTEHAIRGLHGVTLRVEETAPTAELLEFIGYERTGREADRTRYRAGTAGDHAAVIDLVERGGGHRAGLGVGSVHHIAFRVGDETAQTRWREALRERGRNVTEVKDRQYFRSIYFREPGGVLFELATDSPGFDRDETVTTLGSGLKLPPWMEEERGRIESNLPALGTGVSNGGDK